MQSPGAKALADPSQYPRLKEYVQGVVGAFAKDDRILAWDIWNEPGSYGGGDYAKSELKEADKMARVTALLPQAFEWAREANPVAAADQAEFTTSTRRKTRAQVDDLDSTHSTARVRCHHVSQLQLA